MTWLFGRLQPLASLFGYRTLFVHGGAELPLQFVALTMECATDKRSVGNLLRQVVLQFFESIEFAAFVVVSRLRVRKTRCRLRLLAATRQCHQ